MGDRRQRRSVDGLHALGRPTAPTTGAACRPPGRRSPAAVWTSAPDGASTHFADQPLRSDLNTGGETPSGPLLCALIDMAYLTGQPIGDLLALEWRDLGPEGIYFARGKVEKITASKVTVEWTPKLRDVERRLKDLRKERRAFGSMVFVRQDREGPDGQGGQRWHARRFGHGPALDRVADRHLRAATQRSENGGDEVSAVRRSRPG